MALFNAFLTLFVVEFEALAVDLNQLVRLKLWQF